MFADRLTQWLAPLSVEEFRRDHLGRRSVYRPPSATRLATMTDMCTWRVSDLLAELDVPPIVWFTGDGGRHLTAEVTPEAALALHEGGTTLFLTSVPALVPLTADLARELQVPAGRMRTTVFCNRPGAVTPMHFDNFDNFTIQVAGRKRWRVAPNTHVPDPTESWGVGDPELEPDLWHHGMGELPTVMPADAEEHLLTPGAVLYLPRGWWHETDSDEDSISVHVHVTPVTWADAVLATLRARLLRTRSWRESVSDPWNSQRRAGRSAAASGMLTELATVVAGLTPADLLPTEDLTGDHPRRVIRRAGAGIRVRADTAEVRIDEYGARRQTTLMLDGPRADACRALATGHTPMSVHDLVAAVPALHLEEVQALVADLLRAGFLRGV